jgi:hypothetical protein
VPRLRVDTFVFDSDRYKIRLGKAELLFRAAAPAEGKTETVE